MPQYVFVLSAFRFNTTTRSICQIVMEQTHRKAVWTRGFWSGLSAGLKLNIFDEVLVDWLELNQVDIARSDLLQNKIAGQTLINSK